jgi:hypothetical protein
MIYGYPKLSPNDVYIARISGVGLGNLLFPWARCIVACRERGWTLIQPQWWQLDVFSLWQRNRASRYYFGQLKSNGSGLQAFPRLWRLLLFRHIPEPLKRGAPVPEDGQSKIVVFSGIKNYFEDFLDDQSFVREKLFEVACKTDIGSAASRVRNSIVVHVRLGDFLAPSINPQHTEDNQRVQIQWYIAAVHEVRLALGVELPVYVLSDGKDEELAPLLSVNRCTRLCLKDLAGMLVLSCARILVASGSTYSMWGSFLGQMPVLWPPGKRRQILYPYCPGASPEWVPGTVLPGAFLEADVRHRSASRPPQQFGT